jgi:hypothetical protein
MNTLSTKLLRKNAMKTLKIYLKTPDHGAGQEIA